MLHHRVGALVKMGCMALSSWLFSFKAKRVVGLLIVAQFVVSLNSLRRTARQDGDDMDSMLFLNSRHSLISNETGSSTFRDHHRKESFSACLLVMDDNHRLDEWLAYHFYVMPLRYLVVAVDPHSKTSPTQILDKWRNYMTIVVWTDQDFATRNLTIRDTDKEWHKTNKHRSRQGTFYQSCAKYLRQQNRTWTSYHDVDEFMAINTDVVKNVSLGEASILKMIHKYSQNRTRSPEEPALWYQHFQSPCITIARSLYGVVSSTTDEIQRDVPDFINATQFETLRWRYRATPRGKGRDGLAKSVVDVSRLSPPDMARPRTAHRPVHNVCPTPWLHYDALPLGIHHYLGSWEAYSFRDDARKGLSRTIDSWTERSVLQKGGPDDEVRPWIAGFVNQVGVDVAKTLLNDAGLPPNYTLSENRTSEWSRALIPS